MELPGDDAVQVTFYAQLKGTIDKIIADNNCVITELKEDAENMTATIKKDGCCS